MRTSGGFTLVELVVAIAVSGIVLVFASLFVKAPLDAYMATSRRNEIQDSVSIMWPRMEADIHSALPNSARQATSGANKALELLPVVDSARFLSPPGAAPFNTAGYFSTMPHSSVTPLQVGWYFLSVNNTPTSNAYAFTNVMTPVNTQIKLSGTGPGEDTITMSPVTTFVPGSAKRIYLVTRPVTYLCNETAGTLQRFSGYTIAPSQASRNTAAKLTAAGATVSLVARDIKSCTFNAPPAADVNHGQLVIVRITVTKGGETTSIMHQAALDTLQ